MKFKLALGAFTVLAMTALALPEGDDLKAYVLKAHGLDHFNEIEEIRFTFTTKSSRSWEWRVEDNVVTLSEVKDGVVSMITYDRDELEGAPEAVITADKRFINDSFWLMWPLHASWSDDAKMEAIADDVIRLSYPATGGGYSPGDMYTIALDENGLASNWGFHRGGVEQAGLVNSFEDYVTVGPLKLATMHQNDSGFKLAFENLAVKLKGDPRWHVAEPVAE